MNLIMKKLLFEGLLGRITAYCLLLSAYCFCDTHYVSPGGGNIPPYTNWANAATNIQTAVDVASPGETVVVTNGVYDIGETVTPGYSSSNRVVITANITVKSVNGPANTVILGNGPLGNSAIRGVYMSAGILSGFTVSNGHTRTTGDYNYDLRGGGVNMYGGNGIITNCAISGNLANYSGATYFGTVNNCTVSGNSASEGGGTYQGTVNNCVISGNSANSNGGGTYYSTVNNCVISGNSAGNGGGTYYGTINNCTVSGNSATSGGGTHNSTVNNCTISENSAVQKGGGTYFGIVNNSTISGNSASEGGGSYVGTVKNSTISENSADNYGGGTYYVTANNCTISGNSASEGGGTYEGIVNNCIVWDNTASTSNNFYAGTIRYSCSSPLPAGAGNISADPMLVNSSHIATNSPCIGAGSIGYTSGVDIDGEAWKNPPSMGCDEVYANALTGSLSVAISANKTYTFLDIPLTFSADIEGKVSENIWTFGDGTAETNKIEVAHSWSDLGEYDVVVTAFNETYPGGISDSISIQVFTNVHYVNVNNLSPVPPYCSWNTAATNIQDAVVVALDGGTIFVTNGTYSAGGTITPGYSSSNRVVITKNISVKSINGPENTIILGKGPLGDGAVRGVYISAGILSGFTVSNGHTLISGDFNYDKSGGGANMFGGYGIITNCIISGNSAGDNGGGTYFGTVNNSTISGNSAADDGGGTYQGTVNNSTIIGNTASAWNGGGTFYGTVNNCTISENSAGNVGGGTYYSTVNNSTISGNSADNYGGGTYFGIVNNCTISGNSASNGGGSFNGTVNNSTISGNSADNYGGGTYFGIVNNCTISENSASEGGGTYESTVNNSIVYYNSAPVNPNRDSGTYNYSCTTPGGTGGTGNISAHPMLVNSSHIGTNSPCIGAGSISYTSGVDIDGEAWKNPPSMGCDEVYANTLTGSLSVALIANETYTYFDRPLTFSADIVGRQSLNIWTFGDGTSETNKFRMTHSWSDVGEYDVVITAFNETYPGGISDSVSIKVCTNVHYVNVNNLSPLLPYCSWNTAATNIQDAVDAVLNDVTVFVTNGTYSSGGTVTPGYSCSNRVVITNNIIVKSVNGPENTIILGKGPSGNSAVRGVYMSAGILSGFTVSNGHTRVTGDYNYDERGGGANMYGGNGIITNCVISGNSAKSGGGTYYGTINNCTISGNWASKGGGTYYGTVNNCTIRRNLAGNGAGTYFGTINNCNISGNSTLHRGGGTYQSTVNNCTISKNSADDYGGGTYESTVNNCIVWFNTASIASSNFYTGTIRYSCSSPLPAGAGNISADPMLLDSSHIATNSPCIGAGSASYISGVDIDGEPWKNPPSMGCDEVYANALTGSLSVALSANETNTFIGRPLTFSVDIDGRQSLNIWTFGDGTAETNKIETAHSWSDVGEYDVVVTAFNETYPGGISDLISIQVFTNVHYVNVNNLSPLLPYCSWDTAATNIQDAVDVALNGGTIFVTNGIYSAGETVTPGYFCYNRVVITTNISVTSVNGPENTIILGREPLGLANPAVRGVYMSAGILSGFTVSNGYTVAGGNYNYDQAGAGVNMFGGSGIITNCTISGNSAIQNGGGTYYGTVDSCTISGNSAENGGGTCSGTVNNCAISGNSADNYGGGTYGSTVSNCVISGNSSAAGGGTAYSTVNYCTISGNSAGFHGGGAYYGTVNNCAISGNSANSFGGGTSESTVNNCTISGNSAGGGGGTYEGTVNNSAIRGNSANVNAGGNCFGTVNSCAISGNSANSNGGGTFGSIVNNSTISGNLAGDTGGGTVLGTVDNCIIWDNSASSDANFLGGIISYSCSSPLPAGEGNITNNPILLSPSHISPSSPCIGAGTNAYSTGTDIDGEPWKDPPSAGCDELYLTNLTGDLYVDIYAEYTSAVVDTELDFISIIDGIPVSNYWTFGDGSPEADKYIANHYFAIAGEYEVILTAFNNDNPLGVSATAMINIVEHNSVTYYVNKANTTPAHPYNSWSTAATNIQDAVVVASQIKNSLVLVTNGIYNTGETVTPGYSCSNRVVITADITVKSVNGPESTIVLGKGPLGSNAVRGVFMTAGILSGFTVSNGHTMTSGNYWCNQSGGGVNMYGGNGIITNCTISGNSADRRGGGTYYGTVNNCTINGNSASYGGATYNSAVINCTISENEAGYDGGGTCYGTVNNSTISGNSASDRGGGTYHGTVNNCTISGNSASEGGGIYQGTINNCTISGNSAGSTGGGTYYGTANNCTISGNSAGSTGGATYKSTVNNSIVYYNSAPSGFNRYSGTYNYSCTTPDATNGINNISAYPMLLNSSHIATNSPCIGAGSTNYISGVDIDGEAWKNPPSIGCDEVYANALTGSLTVAVSADKTNTYFGRPLAFSVDIEGRASLNIWTFGDGTAETNKIEVAHSWSEVGEYDVVVTAFNETYPDGVSDSISITVVTNVHYVNIDNLSPAPPYLSWETAATNIQDAVNAAFNGGIIFITNGTYLINSPINVNKSLIITSANGPENTIVDGNNSYSCFSVQDYDIKISGLTITNGNANTEIDGMKVGGGIISYAYSLVITNCVITGNSADIAGGIAIGAVYNSIITGNSAGLAGGAYECYLNNCVISKNSAYSGGGAYSSTIFNSSVNGNKANIGGGVLQSIVNNSIIFKNRAELGGGACKAKLHNCVIAENSAYSGGGTYDGETYNSIIYYNSAVENTNRKEGTYEYCCTTPDATNGINNISNNPVLLSFSHIATNSPCIGAGSTNYSSDVDIDGEPWRNPPSIGCDEVYANAISGSLSVAISVDNIFAYIDSPLTFNADIDGKTFGNIWTYDDGSAETNKFQVARSWSATGSYNIVLTAFNETYPAGISDSITVKIVTNIHFVNINNSTPVPPYSSWETAAKNIQDAVDAANNDGKIFVTNGLYLIDSPVDVYKSLMFQSVNGPKKTSVDGNNYAQCFKLYFFNTTISGFTITNGNSGISSDGGGVYCSDTTPVISNCIISGNSTINSGGGVSGGTVNNSVISENSADNTGGGAGYSTVNNCSINGNSASLGGGSSFGIIKNCTIVDNVATNGGGVYDCTIYNSIIWSNFAFNVSNNYYECDIKYSCSTPLPPGAGNIPDDPEFVCSPPFLNGVEGFQLKSTSPCINAGTNAFAPMPFDLAGNPRIIDGTVDMGCYEYIWPPQIATNALIFPAVNSIIFAGKLTNIIWDAGKIIDDIDGTNLTITKIDLHYADTTNFIFEVTNNIANTLGEIEMYIPDGNWDGETNYVLKFEVVDSSSLTNSRVFWDNKFVLVPEPGAFGAINSCLLLVLGIWRKFKI